eukprot:jgi/Mesen1/8731/ME000052S08158
METKEEDASEIRENGLTNETSAIRSRPSSGRDASSSRETMPMPSLFEGALVKYPGSPRRRRTAALFKGRLAELLSLNDFTYSEIWRAAAIEAVATGGLVFTSVTGTIACLEGGFARPSQAIGLLHVAILAFFILASAPASGGHLNPSITLATMLTGLTSLPRGVLYILAQSLGATAGAATVNGIISAQKADKYQLAGCLLRQTLPTATTAASAGATTTTTTTATTLTTTGLSASAGLLSEFAFTLVNLFLAFGIALNPKQQQVFGPIVAPVMIGGVLGLLIFISGLLMGPGYVGAGMNPARCFGPAVVHGGDLWDDNWVFWVGPFLACVAQAVIYNVIPPDHGHVYASGTDIFRLFRTRSTRNPSTPKDDDGDPENNL